jgi:hypothetical protein
LSKPNDRNGTVEAEQCKPNSASRTVEAEQSKLNIRVRRRRVAMQANDPTKLETTLADGRRLTLSLPATNAQWAADGIQGLRAVPATHTGRGEEPPPLPEQPALPLQVALLGLGA